MSREKHIIRYWVGILLVWLTIEPAFAASSLEGLVDSLNVVLQNKQLYVNQKEKKIQAIKALLADSNLSINQEYDINARLYEEYKKFNVDSAMHYVRRNVEIAIALGKRNEEYLSNLNLSLLYSMCGKYREAENILEQIYISDELKHLLPDYYEAYRCYWEYYAISTSNNLYAERKEQVYSDSLLQVADPNSYLYKIHYAGSLSARNPQEAERVLLSLLATEEQGSPRYAAITCSLAGICHRLGRIEEKKKYYILSSIADLKNATRENVSLQCLANMAYDEQDIDLAYRYTQSSIDDAIASNIHFRAAQMYHFYSMISASYKMNAAKVKSNLLTYLTVLCLLAFLMGLLLLVLYHQMRKTMKMKEALQKSHQQLKELNERLNKMNEELNTKNGSLQDLNTLKEKYIAHFFELCSEYVDKMEANQTEIYKLAIGRHYEALVKRLKSTAFIDNELEALYMHFDSIFLNLYPNFIIDFNALLEEGEEVLPKSGHLLNKELRIYALLRLGITDSAKIASFLRCSMSTIYNYRTKLRNKAKGNRDEFEEKVLRIGEPDQ